MQIKDETPLAGRVENFDSVFYWSTDCIAICGEGAEKLMDHVLLY